MRRAYRLATVEKIDNIRELPGAERTEIAEIKGWSTVINRGDFSVGDLCVFVRPMSYIPIADWSSFLSSQYYRDSYEHGRGYVIRNRTLLTQPSEGYIFNMNMLPDGVWKAGVDVTEALEIKQFDKFEELYNREAIVDVKPDNIPIIHDVWVQDCPEILGEFGRYGAHYVMEMMPGINIGMYWDHGKFGIFDDNYTYKDKDRSVFWKAAHNFYIPSMMRRANKNVAIYGTICGPGIALNPYRLHEPQFFATDIIDLDTGKLMDYFEMKDYCDLTSIEMAPVEVVGDIFPYRKVGDIHAFSHGYLPNGKHKGGVIIKPMYTHKSDVTGDWLRLTAYNYNAMSSVTSK